MDRRTLVLNSDFRALSTWPLSLIPAQDAICAVLKDNAYAVEEWPEIIHSPSFEMYVPKVIALRNYAHIHSTPKFCRRSILLRDRYRCQFCNGKFTSEELTFDHVIPRAKGGRTIWENIVSCCVPCNKAKRDKLICPIRMPRQPSTGELLAAGMEFLEPRHRKDYGAWLGDMSDEYWETELEQ